MPAVPFSIVGPIWDQLEATISPIAGTRPLGCHHLQVADRIGSDNFVESLKWDIPDEGVADAARPASMARRGRDDWNWIT
jgi:hypothetical protein